MDTPRQNLFNLMTNIDKFQRNSSAESSHSESSKHTNSSERPSAGSQLVKKLQLQYDIEFNLQSEQKDIHEKRLKSLRENLKLHEEDDWKYTSANKLIGLP